MRYIQALRELLMDPELISLRPKQWIKNETPTPKILEQFRPLIFSDRQRNNFTTIYTFFKLFFTYCEYKPVYIGWLLNRNNFTFKIF